MSDLISRQAAIDTLTRKMVSIPTAGEKDLMGDVNRIRAEDISVIRRLPSAQPEPQWNNHTVACLLADLYGDTCACNYSDISEWLPEKCEVIDACPNPVGVACWEQFLTHREGKDGKQNQD